MRPKRSRAWKARPGCSPNSVRRQDSGQIPVAWAVGDEPEQDPRPGSPFGGEARAVTLSEVASRDGRPRRRNIALDQLAHLHAAERRTASKTTKTHRASRAKGRSFTSPLAITTSKAGSVQPNHTGTVCALPSLRSVVTAGEGASSSQRTRPVQSPVTSWSALDGCAGGDRGLIPSSGGRSVRAKGRRRWSAMDRPWLEGEAGPGDRRVVPGRRAAEGRPQSQP